MSSQACFRLLPQAKADVYKRQEVKSGNLSYKIPVEEDAKGIKGEFDRMAEGINCLLYTSIRRFDKGTERAGETA